MAKTKIKFGDILEISGKEKAVYCGKVESNVEGHHRLLFFSRKKYKIQYVQDNFFERLKQRDLTVKVIGSNKEVAEECRKKEKQKYDRIVF
jgi:hypothetical protein